MLKEKRTSLFSFKNKEEGEIIKSVLETYGTNLMYLHKKHTLKENIEQEENLIRLMEILIKKQKNNPLLIGDFGLNPKVLVYSLAKYLSKEFVTFPLRNKRIISLDLAKLIANYTSMRLFSKAVDILKVELLLEPDIILFINDIHLLFNEHFTYIDLFRPIFTIRSIRCIGGTIKKDYEEEIFKKNFFFLEYFESLELKEMVLPSLKNLIYRLRFPYENFHNIEILPEALNSIIDLSQKYLHTGAFPNKAIDLLDRVIVTDIIQQAIPINSESIFSNILNFGLNNLEKLRIEAFRQGDIPTEFILNEVQTAYRTFFLKNINSFEIINIKLDEFSLTETLVKKVKFFILKHIDTLLFSSNDNRYDIKKIAKVTHLTAAQNIYIYNAFILKFNQNFFVPLSIYRISLILFIIWLKQKQKIKQLNFKLDFFTYLCHFQTKKLIKFNNFKKENTFQSKDIEIEILPIKLLSETDTIKCKILHDSLLLLTPLLRKGIVESLNFNGQLNISDTEKNFIYTLLGYLLQHDYNKFILYFNEPFSKKPIKTIYYSKQYKKQINSQKVNLFVSKLTGIPIQSFSNNESQKLLNLEATLHKFVIGQDDAIAVIAKAIKRSRLGLQNPNRPIASFLFCGPTGVGKTEITKILASTIFGSVKEMIRFDMSEFMDKFTISRLIGSPPGYVGYDEGGQLTDAVFLKPYAIILFDEIEKGHPDILNILLQVLEDGRLTDSKKKLIHFENTIIILTSNVASEEIQQFLKKCYIPNPKVISKKPVFIKKSNIIEFLQSPITENFLKDINQQLKTFISSSFSKITGSSFLKKKEDTSKQILDKNTKLLLKDTVMNKLSTLFLPEFLNRLDDIIVFLPLEEEQLLKICDIMLKEVISRAKKNNIELIITKQVKIKLSQEGYDPLYGARPLRRLITKNIEDVLSEDILKCTSISKLRSLKIKINDQNKIFIEELNI